MEWIGCGVWYIDYKWVRYELGVRVSGPFKKYPKMRNKVLTCDGMCVEVSVLVR